MSIQSALREQLAGLLGDRQTDSSYTLEQHGRDESFHPSSAPDLVVFPRDEREVSEVVKLCSKYRTPIIPFGAGTSLEGHIAALHGGVSLDLSRMNAVLEINREDLDCRVEAGVTRLQLNRELKSMGQFFPVDPGADASIGGMVATSASGTNAVRYGTMRDNVLGLTVVMADGRVVRTGGRSRKSSSGYDLTRLMCGSEGTLGIITEAQLRLFGIPEAVSAAVCSFSTLADAVNSVIPIIQSGIPVARIELLDEVMMAAVNDYSHLNYPPNPTLFFEFHGTAASVIEQAETAAAIVREHGGSDFNWSDKQEERNKLWQARHDALYAAKALRPGVGSWTTDVCVPISRLAECMLESRKDIDRAGIIAPIVGHVGDGNFHMLMLVNPEDPGEMKTADEINGRMIHRALKMGGTSTGEHGIGHGKIAYMREEHGGAIEMMRSIKQSLDPDNLLNPGKVLPSDGHE